MKILIPNTIELPLTADVETVVYDIDADIPDEHRDAEVLVVWHNSSSWLQEAARVLPGCSSCRRWPREPTQC